MNEHTLLFRLDFDLKLHSAFGAGGGFSTFLFLRIYEDE
jgi:hypothetical protein